MRMKEISSTTARLLNHFDRLQEIKNESLIRPITVHLAPTDRCNLDCSFCSVKKRTMNEIPLNEMKEIVDMYSILGATSFEITGGGDPTCYYGLESLIDYIDKKKKGIGLITNGLLLNEISTNALNKLTWLRISLSGIDSGLEKQYYDIDSSRLPSFTGCSYVYTNNTTEKQMKDVSKVAKHLEAKYIRVVPNCYTPDDIEWGRKNIPPAISTFPEMFMQIKDYHVPATCYWKYIKPFVNSDGYVYQCSTCSLFEGKFPEAWRVAKWNDVESIYNEALSSFDTKNCTLCFYSRQNELLHDLIIDVIHPRFL